MAAMLGYGFASGLPFMLSAFTLQQWLSEHGISLHAIGLTALIGLAYTLKFLWAPVLDRPPPPGFRRLGRRRGWLLPVQGLLSLAIAGLALSDPAISVTRVVAAAVLVAVFSATQDIVIDAWRIETFAGPRQGGALAAYIWGYRTAMLVSRAGALWLAGRLGWHGALLTLAGFSLLGPAITLLVTEPVPALMAAAIGWRARLHQAVIEPFRALLTRDRVLSILAFVVLFKVGEAVAGKMAAPFYHALGYDRAQVAAANFLPSFLASLAGAALGGWLTARMGGVRALLLTGMVQMATMTLYLALAWSHGDVHVLYAKVTFESFGESMADTAFNTYLSSLCDAAYAATQYALLASAASLPLHTLGSLSGYMAEALGWVRFYAVTIAASVPAMLILVSMLRRRRTR